MARQAELARRADRQLPVRRGHRWRFGLSRPHGTKCPGAVALSGGRRLAVAPPEAGGSLPNRPLTEKDSSPGRLSAGEDQREAGVV